MPLRVSAGVEGWRWQSLDLLLQAPGPSPQIGVFGSRHYTSPPVRLSRAEPGPDRLTGRGALSASSTAFFVTSLNVTLVTGLPRSTPRLWGWVGLGWVGRGRGGGRGRGRGSEARGRGGGAASLLHVACRACGRPDPLHAAACSSPAACKRAPCVHAAPMRRPCGAQTEAPPPPPPHLQLLHDVPADRLPLPIRVRREHHRPRLRGRPVQLPHALLRTRQQLPRHRKAFVGAHGPQLRRKVADVAEAGEDLLLGWGLGLVFPEVCRRRRRQKR